MKNKQLSKIREHIQEKIESLKREIAAFELITKPISPDNAIGRLTRMEAINSKSINDATLNASKATLSKLEAVLPKIDDPDFGFCIECEEPIPFARLMIVPETDFCVACAEKTGG